jgi:hypothetical protein
MIRLAKESIIRLKYNKILKNIRAIIYLYLLKIIYIYSAALAIFGIILLVNISHYFVHK